MFSMWSGFHGKQGGETDSSTDVFGVVDVLDEDGIVEGYELDIVLMDHSPIDEISGSSTIDECLGKGTTISLWRLEFNGDGQ
jgi:hypothetical protein